MSDQRIARHITNLVQQRGKVGTQAIITDVRAKFPRISAREVESMLRDMRNAGALVASGPDDRRSYMAPEAPKVAKPAPRALEITDADRPDGLALTDRDPAPASPAPGAAAADRAAEPPIYCLLCKRDRPATDFPPSVGRGSFGRRGECRECRRERSAAERKAERAERAKTLRKLLPGDRFTTADVMAALKMGPAGALVDALVRDGLIDRLASGVFRWPDAPDAVPAPLALPAFVAEPLPFDAYDLGHAHETRRIVVDVEQAPTPGAAAVQALAAAAPAPERRPPPFVAPAPALEALDAGAADVADRLAKLIAAETRRAIGGLQAERDDLARDLLVLRRQVQQVQRERDHAEAERVRLERDLSAARRLITETQGERDDLRKKLSGLDVSALRDLRARLDAADRARADAVAERDQARADAAAALELAETAQRELGEQRERIRALLGV